MEFFIQKTPTFDLAATLDSGQVFRYKLTGGGATLIAGRHRAGFAACEDGWKVECDDAPFFKKYLDFDTNYDIIQLKTQDKGLVSSAIAFGRGIHILRQDAAETIFSFLVSQNNHIPRIKGIIERICDALGEDMGGYRAFPTIEALAGAGTEFFASVGAGYRAEYLSRTAERLAEEDLAEWRALPTEELRAKLTSLHGVGRKVADCVLLFGFGRTDVFPVDTWIRKAFSEEYGAMPADKLAVRLVERYGDLSGYVQQWLYYYKREQKNSAKL